MQIWMRRLHLVFAWLFVGAVVLQVFLAGLAIFDGWSWQDHVTWGHTGLALIALLVLVSAAAGRLPRSGVGWAALPLLGYIGQTLLAGFRFSGPTALAALHPAGALVVFGCDRRCAPGASLPRAARRATFATSLTAFRLVLPGS